MSKHASYGLGVMAAALLLSASASATTLARQNGAFGIVTYDSIPVPTAPAGILARQCGAFGIVTYDPAPVDGYAAWAEENGIDGEWDDMSGGIYNAFRYVFGQPTGDFALITGIAVGESEVVITTPAVVNSDGVTVSVVESSDLAGKMVTDTKALEAEGRAEFTKSDETPRFYRLSAEETE